MKDNYEISSLTVAILPLDKKSVKVIEEEENYIVKKSINDVINDSCKYFGSSYIGRHEGTKFLTGISYKAPIVIEESNEMIFFPTSSPRFEDCCWISLKHIDKYEKFEKKSKIFFKNGFSLSIDISFGSLQNQILRSNLLRNVIHDRKITK